MSDEPTVEEPCTHCNGHGVVTVVLNKVCKRCGEPFANRGHRTKGVIYCSDACANASSQAMWRERQKLKVSK